MSRASHFDGQVLSPDIFSLGGSTDSKAMDQQCGIEATINLMTSLSHGANIVLGV
jgi:trimethylamine:corrinoid methyltransferase-like protein